MGTTFARIALIAALGGSVLGALPAGAQGATSPSLRPRHRMLVATNASRTNHDLHRLWIDRKMSDLARKHSVAMANQNTLFHTQNPARHYLKGVHWHYWGENVGVTGGSVGDLEAAFMASTPHRENILRSSFQHVAIGAVRVDGVLWVTVFFYN